MKILLIGAVFLISAILGGCRSTESTNKSRLPPEGSSAVIAESTRIQPPERIKKPTTLRQNASFISAVVDSIVLLDGYDYRLFVTLRDVAAKNNLASLAESGQTIELRPGYGISENGIVDIQNEDNARILGLRHAKPGDTLSGIISLSLNSGWVISKVVSTSSSK